MLNSINLTNYMAELSEQIGERDVATDSDTNVVSKLPLLKYKTNYFICQLMPFMPLKTD